VSATESSDRGASLTDRLEAFFRAHPGIWVDGRRLAEVAGCYAWRSRVSDVRRRGLRIENRQRVVTGGDGRPVTVSEYRYQPAERACDNATAAVVAGRTDMDLFSGRGGPRFDSTPAAQMVAALEQRGISVSVAGGRIRLAPWQDVRPSERAFVRAHPGAVRDALAERLAAAAGRE